MIDDQFIFGLICGCAASAVFYGLICGRYSTMVKRLHAVIERQIVITDALRLVIEGRASMVKESADVR